MKFIHSLCLFTLPFSALLAEETPPPASLEKSTTTCSKEALFSYFPQEFVSKTLEKFHIPEDKRESIEQALAEKDPSIVSLVETAANKKDPTLLQDFNRRQEVAALFQATLLEILTEVLNKNGITDAKQIQAMLEDLQKQKVEQFKSCLNKISVP